LEDDGEWNEKLRKITGKLREGCNDRVGVVVQ
jgi:hypothetical protein